MFAQRSNTQALLVIVSALLAEPACSHDCRTTDGPFWFGWGCLSDSATAGSTSATTESTTGAAETETVGSTFGLSSSSSSSSLSSSSFTEPDGSDTKGTETPTEGNAEAKFRLRVFVTSETYCGDITVCNKDDDKEPDESLKMANEQCKDLADAAGETMDGRKWCAWLVNDSGIATMERCPELTGSENQFFDVKGTTIAENWSELAGGTLQNGIHLDEKGVSRVKSRVWTGAGTNGEPGNKKTCAAWTSGGMGLAGAYGIAGETDKSWTNSGDDGDCADGDNYRLYCFELPPN